MGDKTNDRLNRLDHLRFVGAILVVFWHFGGNLVPTDVPMKYPILSIFEQGHTGVALFCVISGFIFTWLYYDKEIDLRDFAKKRAVRILPLFIVVLALGFYMTPGADITKIVIGVGSTFLDTTLPGYSNVGWTILVEIQFYALFPLLVLLSRRYGWHYLAALIVFLICLRATAWYDAPAGIRRLAYGSIFGRLDQFLLGMLAALALRKSLPLNNLARLAMIGLGVVGAIAILMFFEMFNAAGGYYAESSPTSALWIIIPFVEGASYATILLGYLAIPRIPFTRVIDAAFSHGGKVSYSIYLTHTMVIPLVVKAIRLYGLSVTSWQGNAKAIVFIALPVIVAVASSTYYLIEKPMMDLIKKRHIPASLSKLERLTAA